MNSRRMIQKLKKTGILFAAGLREEEFAEIEAFFGFRFPREIREFLSCGVPVVWTAESEPEGYAIHQIADDGTFLYILSDAHNGVVLVFDRDGTYLRTMAFYPHMNGAFRIAAEADTLYVLDKQQNLYVFRDGQFEVFLNREKADAILEKMDLDGNDPGYEIRDGSVWRVENGEETCVLHRPKSAAAYRRNVTLVSGIIVLALLGAAGLIRHGGKR